MTRVFVAAGVVLSALPLGVVLWGREQGATSSQPAEDMTKSTVTDEDIPTIGVSDILPLLMQKNDTEFDVSQKLRLYAVWYYPSAKGGTYWPLGHVDWEVRYAGALTTGFAPEFKPGANNAVKSSSKLVRSNALPAQALTVTKNVDPKNKNQTPIGNKATVGWYLTPK